MFNMVFIETSVFSKYEKSDRETIPAHILKKNSGRNQKCIERDIGLEILNGIREIKAYKAGDLDLKTGVLAEPSSPKEIRNNLQLSQAAFAGLMGVSLRMVQDWEQGKREPVGRLNLC